MQDPSAPATVVVADDSERFRAGLVRALDRHPGIAVVADVPNGLAAVEACREHRPAVLVVDDRMPGLGGVGVALELAQDSALAGIRVVLLTANTSPELDGPAREAGVRTRLDKNASRREICAVIHREAQEATARP